MLVLLATFSAQAQVDPGLSACCAAVGEGVCPDRLEAVGATSAQTPSPTGAQVVGVWTLQCATGASWDPAARRSLRSMVPAGTVVSPVPPEAVGCFDAACRLPEGLCVRWTGERVQVVQCADGAAPSDFQWTAPGRSPRRAAVISGRLVGTGPTPAPAPVAPARPVAANVDTSVPPLPPEPCIPSSALREPSNQQVDAGNEAIVAGDLGTAIDRYRAAITINKCNAFAWVALGDALLQVGSPRTALPALQAATRLMPTHFHAWTRLGEAAEQNGDRVAAAAAYTRALEVKPDHAPAAQGLQRVR